MPPIPDLGSSCSPTLQPAQPPTRWTPENECQVNACINEAMQHAHGNVEQAFAYLRDMRQQPENYYDTNMAIAADYLRARWDTARFGPDFERTEIAGYMEMKKTVGVPREGPGPVSPYSKLEEQYMYKGVADQVDSQSALKNGWQHTLPGETWGAARGAWSLAEPTVERGIHKAEAAAGGVLHGTESMAGGALHGAEHVGGKVLKFFHL